jgi:hypothetical protein
MYRTPAERSQNILQNVLQNVLRMFSESSTERSVELRSLFLVVVGLKI